ncbi:MAG: adenylate/guanylate cyclase domain-containing protein, partial [Candidatus Dormiibacterota bacterium]
MEGEAAPSPATTTSPAAEVRLVSVLFVDLVGFTSLSETRDAEDMRELLSSYFAVAREVVGRHGGSIEKFIGDAVMAVWGAPLAHEDDALRAVRAGLELVAAVSEFAERVGAPMLRARG